MLPARKKASGKYFVSVLCQKNIDPLEKTGAITAVDLGITDFAIFPDGRKVDNNRFPTNMAQKLKREQRKLSKRALVAKKNDIELFHAKNYKKQKRKVAILHEKVANQRNDFLHKLSTELIKNHDAICIETLGTKDMMRNKKFAKSIADVSGSSFVSKLEYKAEWYGKTIIKMDRSFASTQICSDCGNQDGKKPLHIREWVCKNCHAHHDRDVNASKNILNKGMAILATS